MEGVAKASQAQEHYVRGPRSGRKHERRKRNCKASGHGGLEQWTGPGAAWGGRHHPESHGKGLSWGCGVTRSTILTDGSVARWLGVRVVRGGGKTHSSLHAWAGRRALRADVPGEELHSCACVYVSVRMHVSVYACTCLCACVCTPVHVHCCVYM